MYNYNFWDSNAYKYMEMVAFGMGYVMVVIYAYFLGVASIGF